jgi:hypothetical protein
MAIMEKKVKKARMKMNKKIKNKLKMPMTRKQITIKKKNIMNRKTKNRKRNKKMSRKSKKKEAMMNHSMIGYC